MTEFHGLLTFIPIAKCDLDSPFHVTIINTDKSERAKKLLKSKRLLPFVAGKLTVALLEL